MAMQGTSKQSFSRRWESYQPSKSILVWACVLTAVVTMIVGFGWGGWVTGGTSRTAATTAGTTARAELASAICVERFNAAADAATQLAGLKALTDAYKRREFVAAGGWATMPGETAPTGRTADLCAVALSA